MARADAIVIGGGPSGTATAIALRLAGRKVELIERSNYGEWRAGETLPPDAAPLLAALGVRDRMLGVAATAFRGVGSAWGGETLAHRDFIFTTAGAGWHLDRRLFDAALADAAEAAGATVRRATRPTSIGAEGGVWRVCLAGGDQVEARFLVDATGRAGSLARAYGARWLDYDRLVGIAGTLAGRAAEGLLLESIADGWWYSVPQPDGSLLAALMIDRDALRGDPAARWREGLRASSHTAARTRGSAPTEIRVRKACAGRLAPASGRGWVAVGDAASAYDPLAGAGLMKALASGLAAAAAIDADLRGDAGALARYSAEVAQSFDRHLRERAVTYRREQRWRDRRFWQRRQPIDPQVMPLTLDPSRRPSSTSARGTSLEGLLALPEIARLCALADHHTTSAGAIAAFVAGDPVHVPDRWAIAALQTLVECSERRTG